MTHLLLQKAKNTKFYKERVPRQLKRIFFGYPHKALKFLDIQEYKANYSTQKYTVENMMGAKAVRSKSDLFALAIANADLGGNKLICEFGVYKGTTINEIATIVRRTVYGFDSFDGLPQKWRRGRDQGTFALSHMPALRDNVVLVKGLFAESLPSFLSEHQESVGFIHIDCDIYSSTKTVFDLLGRRIHPGCVIVFDEYFNYPGWQKHEFKAFKEFIARTNLKYRYLGYNSEHQQVAIEVI